MDLQFADAQPDEVVTTALQRPDVGLAEVITIVLTGYADRPALGQRQLMRRREDTLATVGDTRTGQSRTFRSDQLLISGHYNGTSGHRCRGLFSRGGPGCAAGEQHGHRDRQ